MFKGLSVFAGAAMIMFCSCSSSGKITKVETEDLATYSLSSYPCRFYDDGTKIRYDFRTEGNTLQIIVQTDNEAAKQRIMGPGLKIFVNSKKSEDSYFLFPAHHGDPGNTTAARVDHGMTDYFDINSNKYNVSYTCENKGDGFLTYIFKMPYSKGLVIGITAPDADRNRSGHGTAATSLHSGGGMHGGMGGGMHSGGMGGGMRGSGMHGGGHDQFRGGENGDTNINRNDATGNIHWWFKIA